MIELEIQALSMTREGLVIDVGRSVVAGGYTLQRQRLVQDPHGVLLTMVVRGPERKQRALETALEANERLISFEVTPFEDGPPKPHFAATRVYARPPVAPLPAAPPVESAAPAPPAIAPKPPVAAPPPMPMQIEVPTVVVAPAPAPPSKPAPEPEPELEPEFVFIRPSAPAPAPPAPEPFVELIVLDADTAAVEKVLPELEFDYPKIFPWLTKLQDAVVAGARESSLQLAGQQLGARVFARDNTVAEKLGLDEAMQRIGMPALHALAEVEYTGGQLHIRHSPLCNDGGHSGCVFFSGYLEGLLAPAIQSSGLSFFSVCCRSFGADQCVLAISD